MYTQGDLEEIQDLIKDQINIYNRKEKLTTFERLDLENLKELFYKTKSQIN